MKTAPEGGGTPLRGLTHSLDLTKEGLMPKSIHPVGGWPVDPITGVVFGVSGRWRGKRLGRVGNHGYLVTMHKRKVHLLHRVVWEACVGPIPDGMVINHKNGIKTDNRLENLEVVTSSFNNAHAYRTGLKVHSVTGPQNHNYRITPVQHEEILRRLQLGVSGVLLAAEFGVSTATISRIRRGVRCPN